jgi:hypothetical protein
MKLALAALALILSATAAHADCYNTTIPPVPAGDYSYVNAYYEWTAPNGTLMEQFFFNIGDGDNVDFPGSGASWIYGPVSEIPPMTAIAPDQFPAGPGQSAPEPATYALLSAGILTLIALKWYVRRPI